MTRSRKDYPAWHGPLAASAALALGLGAAGCIADDPGEFETVELGERAFQPAPRLSTPAGDTWLDYPDPAEFAGLIYGADTAIEEMETFVSDSRSMTVHDAEGDVGSLSKRVAAAEAKLAAADKSEVQLAKQLALAEKFRQKQLAEAADKAVFNGTPGIDVLQGGDENDVINGYDGDDTLSGGNGNDYITGGPGADTINGEGGFDTAAYVSSSVGVNVSVSGTGSGGDAEGDVLSNIEVLRGSGQDDTLSGDATDNQLYGGDGNDTLNGGDGNDYFVGGAGGDAHNGGAGEGDFASYGGATAGVNANLGGTGSGGDAAGDTYSGIEHLRGTDSNDTLTGNSGNNTILGANGSDTINGGAGDDFLIGGDGGDSLNGGDGEDWGSWAGNNGAVVVNLATNSATGGHAAGDTFSNLENLRGGEANDTLTGNAEDNVLVGAGGNDIIVGGDGNDGLLGSEGMDNVQGGLGDDSLNGGDGADTLDGGDGIDMVSYEGAPAAVVVEISFQTATGGGSHGGDTLMNFEGAVGSDFDDTLHGDDGPNKFKGGPGNDTINGGDERDTVSYSSHEDPVTVTVNSTGSSTGGAAGETDSLNAIENAIGGKANDIINGDNGRNTLSGRAGNDTINGNGDVDTVSYESREEDFVIDLAAGSGTTAGESDTLISIEYAVGGEGNDTLIGDGGPNVLDGREGADSHNGGAGTDTVGYSEARGGVTVDLVSGGTGGEAAGDTYTSIENLRGSEHDDIMRGDDNPNTILTAEGDDRLEGRGGNDFLIGGMGADVLDGGTGSDQANYSPSMTGVMVDLAGTGAGGDAAGDTYISIENVRGSNHDDMLFGDSAANLLIGANGNDTLDGRGGNDALLGSSGDDTYIIGDGTDTDTVIGFLTAGNNTLDVSALGYSSLGEVQAACIQQNTTTVIPKPGGGTVRLNAVNCLGDLNGGQFTFSAVASDPPRVSLVPVDHRFWRANLLRQHAIRPPSARETLDALA